MTNIRIEYSPRENAYVWGVHREGHATNWRKGKTTVDATQIEAASHFPNCEFTVSP